MGCSSATNMYKSWIEAASRQTTPTSIGRLKTTTCCNSQAKTSTPNHTLLRDLPYSEAIAASFCASLPTPNGPLQQGFNIYNANKPKMSRAAAALRA
eukprot:scaffold9102_cov157-Skeletonema_dohrnii-CCMP3373.AAC.6